jgi:hypothetical protein
VHEVDLVGREDDGGRPDLGRLGLGRLALGGAPGGLEGPPSGEGLGAALLEAALVGDVDALGPEDDEAGLDAGGFLVEVLREFLEGLLGVEADQLGVTLGGPEFRVTLVPLGTLAVLGPEADPTELPEDLAAGKASHPAADD